MWSLDIFFFLFVCVVAGTGVHFFIPRVSRAAIVAGIFCGVFGAVLGSIHEGIKLGRVFLLFIVYGFYGWVFSSLIGLPFYLVRRWTSRH